MDPAQTFLSLLLYWIGLPLALSILAKRLSLPSPGVPLCVTAACALFLIQVVSDDPNRALALLGQGFYRTIFMVISSQRYLMTPLLFLFGTGGVAMIAIGMAIATRSACLCKMASFGHWGIHLAFGGILVIHLGALPDPQSVLDYDEVRFWRRVVFCYVVSVGLPGMAAVLIVFASSSVRMVLRR